MCFTTPLYLVTHPSLPVKSVKQLIALARTQPGRLTFASGGNATTNHLAGELFKQLAGVDMLHVPYKSAAPAMRERFNTLEVTPSAPEAFAEHVKREIPKWRKVFESAKIASE